MYRSIHVGLVEVVGVCLGDWSWVWVVGSAGLNWERDGAWVNDLGLCVGH